MPVYTQYPQNAKGRWRYEHSLLDRFEATQGQSMQDPRRVFVTLGTTKPWQFRRLVDRMHEIIPANVKVRYQTGVTEVSDLDIDYTSMMSDEEFQAEIAAADVVVTHSGVGTFISCLSAGKVPVMIPRRASFDEHVDDHQDQIASVASSRGLALRREAHEVTFEDLRTVRSLSVRQRCQT
ncbi:glycosyltransferase [Serinicoccus sp. CNJ-927]|uniref:glycosyltransferase n=1 Tax=Serinicoccus sp. CNJ-927 TaxID=1904970 RepID=UPI0013019292|nr:glycosyltransferase [Serinicoccus sp. CNJ-927]